MKLDRDAKVSEVAEAAGDVLEGLACGVEAFSEAVADVVPEPDEDSGHRGEDHLGDAAEGGDTAGLDAAPPGFEEGAGGRGEAEALKGAEFLLQGP